MMQGNGLGNSPVPDVGRIFFVHETLGERTLFIRQRIRFETDAVFGSEPAHQLFGSHLCRDGALMQHAVLVTPLCPTGQLASIRHDVASHRSLETFVVCPRNR